MHSCVFQWHWIIFILAQVWTASSSRGAARWISKIEIIYQTVIGQSLGQLSGSCQAVIGQSVIRHYSVIRQLVDSWWTVGRQSAGSQQAVARQLLDSHWTIGGQSPDRCRTVTCQSPDSYWSSHQTVIWYSLGSPHAVIEQFQDSCQMVIRQSFKTDRMAGS